MGGNDGYLGIISTLRSMNFSRTDAYMRSSTVALCSLFFRSSILLQANSSNFGMSRGTSALQTSWLYALDLVNNIQYVIEEV